MNEMVGWLAPVLLVVLALSMVLACVRLVLSRHVPDRVVALDLMTTIAVGLVGVYALGKAQREQGLDASALAGLLGQQRKEIESREPAVSGIMGKLLDSDGDGDVDAGDIARKGMSMLGKFFKK